MRASIFIVLCIMAWYFLGMLYLHNDLLFGRGLVIAFILYPLAYIYDVVSLKKTTCSQGEQIFFYKETYIGGDDSTTSLLFQLGFAWWTFSADMPFLGIFTLIWFLLEIIWLLIRNKKGYYRLVLDDLAIAAWEEDYHHQLLLRDITKITQHGKNLFKLHTADERKPMAIVLKNINAGQREALREEIVLLKQQLDSSRHEEFPNKDNV